MEINVYVRSVYEEFKRGKKIDGIDNEFGYALSSDGKTQNVWPNNWGASYVSLDNNNQRNVHGVQRIRELRIRDKDGMVFDPITTAVFKADDDAIKTIRLLQNGNSIQDVKNQMNITEDKMNNFIERMEQYTLW